VRRAAEAYAQAVFESAYGDWVEQLRALQARLAEEPGLVERLDDAERPLDERRELLDGLLKRDTAPQARNLLHAILSNGDVSNLESIVAHIERRISGAGSPAEAQVVSAIALLPEERGELERRLRARYGEDVQVRYRTDPEILGGLIVRVGDHYVDGSVAARLGELAHAIRNV
jgi:F-type H+-transporting ATPase subunit delta